MIDYKLPAAEAKFADLVWSHAPLPSAQLVRLCEAELGWKKSTTYTVLRRLSDRGLFRNENGTVTVFVSREEFYARQSRAYVAEAFGGSLPRFLAAFTSREKLSDSEAAELQALIDRSRG